MMKTKIALADPGSVEATMTLTMRLDDWKRLRRHLRGSGQFHVSGDHLMNAIDNLVAQVEAHFEGDLPEGPAAAAEASGR